MRERRYTACYDDGHDYGSFTFWSEHRAGSKANKEDAMKQFIRTYGYARSTWITITQTYRCEG